MNRKRNRDCVGSVMVMVIISVGLCGVGRSAWAAESALDFNNVHDSNDDQHVQFGNIGSHAEYTAEAWINPRRISGNGDHASHGFTIFGTANDYSLWLLHRDGEIKAFAYEGGTTAYTETNGAGIETNTFTHVALTAVQNGTAQIYVNGVLMETFDAGSRNNWGNLALGVLRAGRGIGMDGIIMEARLWDHVRSETEIQDLMYVRLSGDEEGLLGYWPMNEGEGDTAYDLSGNDRDGSINGPTWVFLEENPFAAGEDFLRALPFTLADIETGSNGFTNSNEVDIVDFPIPDGYDQFQITEDGDVGAIDAGAWTNVVPDSLEFTQPSGDTNITFYAWFTNATESVELSRSLGTIFYTEVAPVPLVNETVAIERLPGQNAVIYLWQIDIGSSGGVAAGREMAVFDRKLLCAEEPSCDLTPDDPFITVDDYGDYPIVLWLQNEAGNTAVSTMTSMVSVIEYSGTNVWTGEGLTDSWHDPVNWSVGIPQAGQHVRIDSAPDARLTNATAALASFRITSGRTLTVEGWHSALEATEMTIEGTITHVAQTVTEPDSETGEWVPQHRIWLKGSDVTVAGGGRLQANFLGYVRGAGPGSVSRDRGGAGHAGDGGRGGAQHAWGGTAYGDPVNPWQPGSGGAGGSGNSRPGGGAIRIEATGQVTVDGEITANGQNGASTHGSGGSGGSIWINTHTIQGTGLIAARGGGGDRQGGQASGGRIAVHYHTQAQAALGSSTALRFNGGSGTPGSGSTGHRPASMASLYLPDTLWIEETLEAGRFQHVRLEILDWDHWAPSQLTLEDSTIGLPVGFHLQVTGALTLRKNAGLHVYPAPVSDPLTDPGALVEIGGNFEVGPNCWVYPWGDITNGATVVFHVDGGFTVDEDGGFDANGLGYDRRRGPGEPGNNRGGGGYGGKGGDYDWRRGGDPYGDPDVPVELGSGGDDGEGGGAIRVLVGGNADIRGLLTANGGRGRGTHGSAGSGGTIFVSAGGVVTGDGTLQADGTSGDRQGGDGGGGRIAVWYRVPPAFAWGMMTTQNVDHLHPMEHPDLTFNVDTGTNRPGDPGSVRYYLYAVPGTLFMIR